MSLSTHLHDNTHDSAPEFQFSPSQLTDYAAQHRPSLQLEEIYTCGKYPGIDEDHFAQRKMTKARFRSRQYPEITAESEIDIAEHIEKSMRFATNETITPVMFQERICSWLCSSGRTAILKKELSYMAAITKQDLKDKKNQWLRDNNVIIKDVSVEDLYGMHTIYYITLQNTTSEIGGKAR